jgi:hypothetical protein
MPAISNEQQREVDRQVDGMLGKSAGFRALSHDEQAEVRKNTAAIVAAMAENGLAQAASAPAPSDPFAVPLVTTTPPGMAPGTMPGLPGAGTGGSGAGARQFTGGAQPNASRFGPEKAGDFGSAIATGVAMAGELLRQVNFPAFVSELVQGVFQAVVDASIQQMKAYGELVQGVVMSLNDFRDANVTENQGRDHLVSKFPQLMQINMGDSGPRVGLRPDANTDDLPDIAAQFGLPPGSIADLDDDVIEEQLVPAARNDLARSRQSLLATMLLMGINRIVVTDGRINAKLMFDFKARDNFQRHAQSYDYQNFGVNRASQSTHESSEETGENYQEKRQRSNWGTSGAARSGESSRWSKGTDQYTETPAIYLTAIDDQVTSGELEAKAKLSGEVSLNFKSETFDLNKLASADEIFKLERVRSGGAGRGAPAAGTPGAGTAPAGQPAPGGNTAGNTAPTTSQTPSGNTQPAG